MELNNWLDNALGFFSPTLKARRLQARLASGILEDYFKRRYEGAAQGRRTKGWQASGTSANAEIGPALSILRNRSRDLVRNNGYAKSGIGVIQTEVVGRGIVGQTKAAKPDVAEKLDEIWKEWAEETWVDYDGLYDLYGLQHLVMGTVAESGECLIRLRRAHSKDLKGGLPIPIQIQVIEGDFLDTSLFAKPVGDNFIIQGVEFNPNGRRVAYHLYESHPGDISVRGSSFKTNRIPAEEILHIFDVCRAGQVRGVPWLAPALLKLRDLDDYEDAQLVRQKMAACFAAFVEDMELPETTTASDRGLLGEKLEPGMIEILPPGKKITFGSPPGCEGFKEFMTIELQAIASALGVTYESLTGDLSQVNFSSARMGWLKMQRNIDGWRRRLMIGQFMKPLFWWFIQSCDLMGISIEGARPEFTAPRREMIDPTKEVPATVEAIRAGLTTLPEAIKQNGRDPQEVFQEIKETNDKLDELGLTLESDPRRTDKSGKKKEEADEKEDKNA